MFTFSIKILMKYCRQNLVGSLPRGMPMVVDESIEVHMRKPDGDIECKRQWLDRFRPSVWCNTLCHVSLWIVLHMIRWKWGESLPGLYSSGGRVTDRLFLSWSVLQDRKLQILREMAYPSRFPRSLKIFTQCCEAWQPVSCLARHSLVGWALWQNLLRNRAHMHPSMSQQTSDSVHEFPTT